MSEGVEGLGWLRGCTCGACLAMPALAQARLAARAARRPRYTGAAHATHASLTHAHAGPAGTPALTLYLREAPGAGWALLASGLAVTAASVAATLGIQWAHRRKLKQH